jgi:hypothetical protein
MTNRNLFVAGQFNDLGGRESKIANKLYGSLNLNDTDFYNGGKFSDLEDIVDKLKQYQLIFWFADVPNDKTKLVGDIKDKNSSCILITSKRNLDKEYNFLELVAHALNIKSNLFIEFTKEDNRYLSRIIDPLGNVFLDYSQDIDLAGMVLSKRVKELSSYRRVPSKNIGSSVFIPNEDSFFYIVKNYANIFHKLIHTKDSKRFLGNTSFRCERGFPSCKEKEKIYVSRRNVDKRHLDKEAFVCVSLNSENPIEYFGDFKPSVDTPIQVSLYKKYPNVKYMLHSHTYIENAPFTKNIIPCGAIEEAEDIISLFPDKNSIDFYVNLKGHGSLALVSNTKNLENIKYISRNSPEIHRDYSLEFISK